jgi:hypothetical protein
MPLGPGVVSELERGPESACTPSDNGPKGIFSSQGFPGATTSLRRNAGAELLWDLPELNSAEMEAGAAGVAGFDFADLACTDGVADFDSALLGVVAGLTFWGDVVAAPAEAVVP